MKLTNNRCAVEVTLDDNFDFKSADHREYDFVLNIDGYTAQDYYRVLSLSVNLFHDKYKIALVGSGQSYPDDCAVLDDEVLTVIQDNRVVRLDLHNRTVIETYDTDLYGCAFGLYSTPDEYFIHGELEVARYDKDFNKKWGFSGRDIFVSSNNKQAFQLLEDRVCLYDFEDNYYELDYNGNQLLYLPHDLVNKT